VCVDGGVAGGSGQVFAVLVRNVLAVAVLVALGETKVDHIDAVTSRFSSPDEEIVGLDIPVDNTVLVAFLNSLNHLNSNHQDSLEVQTFPARLEEVFERRSEQIHDHDVEADAGDRVVSADVVELGHACFASQLMNKFALPEEHRVLLVLYCFFNFCSVHLACLLLLNLEDLSECATSEFLDDFEPRLEYFLAI